MRTARWAIISTTAPPLLQASRLTVAATAPAEGAPRAWGSPVPEPGLDPAPLRDPDADHERADPKHGGARVAAEVPAESRRRRRPPRPVGPAAASRRTGSVRVAAEDEVGGAERRQGHERSGDHQDQSAAGSREAGGRRHRRRDRDPDRRADVGAESPRGEGGEGDSPVRAKARAAPLGEIRGAQATIAAPVAMGTSATKSPRARCRSRRTAPPPPGSAPSGKAR